MTWATFINAIHKAELDSGRPAQILLSLFKSAGYVCKKQTELSEATTEAWISGKRSCKVYSYFPEGKLLNPEGAYKFFRRRSKDKLERLQQIFCAEKDGNSPIDCKTKDMDIFCWSLVNQFLDLLKLQRLDIEVSDTVEKIATTSENEVSRNTSVECNRVTLPKEDTHSKLQQGMNGTARIAIPQDCKICFCCKNWVGVKVARDIADEYGECKAYGKRVLASNIADCVKFREDYGKVMSYQQYRQYGYLMKHSKSPSGAGETSRRKWR